MGYHYTKDIRRLIGQGLHSFFSRCQPYDIWQSSHIIKSMTKSNDKDLDERQHELREIREEADVSRQDLADLLRVSLRTTIRWENTKGSLNQENFDRAVSAIRARQTLDKGQEIDLSQVPLVALTQEVNRRVEEIHRRQVLMGPI